MKDVLGAVATPAHAGAVEAHANEVADGALSTAPLPMLKGTTDCGENYTNDSAYERCMSRA